VEADNAIISDLSKSFLSLKSNGINELSSMAYSIKFKVKLAPHHGFSLSDSSLGEM
jgi:hypothetical protein